MAEDLLTVIETILKTYAAEVKAKFDLPIEFNPEDQLKSPITTLFKSAGSALNLKVEAVTEVHAAELGRPDVGVAVKGLLAGHVELKAPGKGADPDKLKGADKGQWERFKNLPNLIYTGEYLVVLAERKGYLLPWTAYVVDRPHRKKKLLKEFEDWQKKQVAKG